MKKHLQTISFLLFTTMFFIPHYSASNERILGDGSLPLKLDGAATSLDAQSTSLPASINITNATRTPRIPTQHPCQSGDQSLYQAQGQIRVDRDLFAIKEICLTNTSQRMEVKAESSHGQVILRGNLNQTERDRQIMLNLSGNLNGTVRGEVKRYHVNMETTQRR